MIKYKLYCKECSNTFDSWFASSKEYEKIKKLNYLCCNKCNSSNIHKSLMAPNLLKTKKDKKIRLQNDKKFVEVKKIKKVFMETFLSKKQKNCKMKELKPRLFLG